MKKILDPIVGFFRRTAKNGDLFAALLIVSVLLLNLIFYTLDATYGLYLYEPKGEDFSLSDAPDAFFASLLDDMKLPGAEKVTVTFCTYEDALGKHPTGRLVLGTAKEMAERYPDLLELRFVNLNLQRDADGNVFDVKDERFGGETLTQTSVIFSHGDYCRILGSTAFADFFVLSESGGKTVIDAYNGEEIMSAMILSVASDSAAKTAYFTTLHGESMDASFLSMLGAAGYTVDALNLSEVTDVPEDAALVIISNPVADFERALAGTGVRSDMEKIEKYLEKGGYLYVTVDPYAGSLPNLEGLLLKAGIGISATEDGTRNIVEDENNGIPLTPYTVVADYAGTALAGKIEKTVGRRGGVVLREAAALTLTGDAEALLVSSADAQTKAAGKVTDRNGSYPLAAMGSFAGEGKIFASATVFLNVSDAIVSDGYTNKDFFFALTEEAFGNENLPYGCKIVRYNTEMLENMTRGIARRDMILILSLPTALAVCGIVIRLRRKNR